MPKQPPPPLPKPETRFPPKAPSAFTRTIMPWVWGISTVLTLLILLADGALISPVGLFAVTFLAGLGPVLRIHILHANQVVIFDDRNRILTIEDFYSKVIRFWQPSKDLILSYDDINTITFRRHSLVIGTRNKDIPEINLVKAYPDFKEIEERIDRLVAHNKLHPPPEATPITPSIPMLRETPRRKRLVVDQWLHIYFPPGEALVALDIEKAYHALASPLWDLWRARVMPPLSIQITQSIHRTYLESLPILALTLFFPLVGARLVGLRKTWIKTDYYFYWGRDNILEYWIGASTLSTPPAPIPFWDMTPHPSNRPIYQAIHTIIEAHLSWRLKNTEWLYSGIVMHTAAQLFGEVNPDTLTCLTDNTHIHEATAKNPSASRLEQCILNARSYWCVRYLLLEFEQPFKDWVNASEKIPLAQFLAEHLKVNEDNASETLKARAYKAFAHLQNHTSKTGPSLHDLLNTSTPNATPPEQIKTVTTSEVCVTLPTSKDGILEGAPLTLAANHPLKGTLRLECSRGPLNEKEFEHPGFFDATLDFEHQEHTLRYHGLISVRELWAPNGTAATRENPDFKSELGQVEGMMDDRADWYYMLPDGQKHSNPLKYTGCHFRVTIDEDALNVQCKYYDQNPDIADYVTIYYSRPLAELLFRNDTLVMLDADGNPEDYSLYDTDVMTLTRPPKEALK